MSSALWNQEDSRGKRVEQWRARPLAKSGFSVRTLGRIGILQRALLAAVSFTVASSLCVVPPAQVGTGRISSDTRSPPTHQHKIWNMDPPPHVPGSSWDLSPKHMPSLTSPSRKRTQPLFPQRFSSLLVPATWPKPPAVTAVNLRLEKAQAATGLHLKGPRSCWTPTLDLKDSDLQPPSCSCSSEWMCPCLWAFRTSGCPIYVFQSMFLKRQIFLFSVM